MSEDRKLEGTVITDLPVVKNNKIDEYQEKRKIFEERMKLENVWGYGLKGIEAKRAAMTMLSTKNGMYAKIPIVCKADSCPYAESCQILPTGLAPEGQYCPMETAEIEIRFAGYCNDFDIEKASFTDKNLISEIISCDIMLERCKALIAKEGVPVVDIVAGISERGEEYTQPEVSKYWEAYERISKKRNTDLQLMMATRRDKKDNDPGAKAKNISDILAEVSQEDMAKEANK